jgi:hypothetical protein
VRDLVDLRDVHPLPVLQNTLSRHSKKDSRNKSEKSEKSNRSKSPKRHKSDLPKLTSGGGKTPPLAAHLTYKGG